MTTTTKLFAVRFDEGYAGPRDLTIQLPGKPRKRFTFGVTDPNADGYPYAEFEGTDRQARSVRESGLSCEPIGRSALAPSRFAAAPQQPPVVTPPVPTSPPQQTRGRRPAAKKEG